MLKLLVTEELTSNISNRKLDAVSKLKDVALVSWSMAPAKKVTRTCTYTLRMYSKKHDFRNTDMVTVVLIQMKFKRRKNFVLIY